MNQLPFTLSTRLAVALAAICLTTAGTCAQNPTADANQTPATGQAAPAPANAEDAWLAKTARLYYSSAKAGLTGFDCDVHPDWHALFVSANKGAEAPNSDAHMALLKTVKIKMHARMKGGSTIDWVMDASPDKPLDEDTTEMLDGMHQSVQQTLEGFLQFWSPFMEVSIVPDRADGLEITHGATSHTIHAKQGETELTEVFNRDLVLEQFNVVLSGTSIQFAPAYESTPQGLLVNAFSADILPAGATAGQGQKMRVKVDYQTVDGLTIPARLNMDVVGTGTFNFTFDGCTTNLKKN